MKVEKTNDIKAVYFDVGSTLLDPDPGIDGVFVEVAHELGLTAALEEVSPYMMAVEEFYEKEYVKNGDFWCSPAGSVEIYLDMYRYLSHLVGLGEYADDIAHGIYRRYLKPEYWRIYDDVKGCLIALKKQHMRLAVVSNWAPYLTSLMRDISLAPYFDEIIASADVGYRKPDPMIFTVALERMGIDARHVIHVGDRPEADGEGAQAAGIHPVIIDRFGWYGGAKYPCLTSLSDLPAYIANISDHVF